MSVQHKHENKPSSSPFRNVLATIIKGGALIIFFCGVPGICVLLLSYFIIKHVSFERKQEIIDAMRLIIENDKASMLFVYMVIGLLALVFIYNGYWKGREKLLIREMKEAEKSAKAKPQSINQIQ